MSFRTEIFLLHGGRIDAKFSQQPRRHLAIGKRRLNGYGSTISQQQPPTWTKFITFRMSAEIVVIVEDKNAGRRPSLFAIEVCGCQTTDTAPHNYKVIRLARLDWLARFLPEISISHAMSSFKCSGMTAPHPRPRGRVIARSILSGSNRGILRQHEPRHPSACNRATHADGHTIQKVSTGYAAMHAQLPISNWVGFPMGGLRVFRVSHNNQALESFSNRSIGLVNARSSKRLRSSW